MIRLWAGVLLLLLAVVPARAETVVLGLSQSQVAITATFEGSSILIFGAVKRDRPVPEGRPLDVVVTVKGPPVEVDVRRKERRFGIWVNADSVSFPATPSFYAVASTGPLVDILGFDENRRYKISLETEIEADMTDTVRPNGPLIDFQEALVRIRGREDLFQTVADGVTLDEQTLFRTRIDLPAKLVEGAYETRIFLVRDGVVIDTYDTMIDVWKVGLERWLYTLAHDQPPIYGVLALVIAVVAGWGASALFRAFQR
ncbi:MAG: TIGR02186 family protein [Qingshengfaniella sp.]